MPITLGPSGSANYFQEEYFGVILDEMGEVRALTLMREWLRGKFEAF